jgi:hypothetical protein
MAPAAVTVIWCPPLMIGARSWSSLLCKVDLMRVEDIPYLFVKVMLEVVIPSMRMPVERRLSMNGLNCGEQAVTTLKH